MDNSDSEKRRCQLHLQEVFRVAHIFAYIGPFGFILNNELREGSSNCNCEGTTGWLEQTLAMAEKTTKARRLLVTDAGPDASDNLLMLDQAPATDFLVNRNQ